MFLNRRLLPALAALALMTGAAEAADKLVPGYLSPAAGPDASLVVAQPPTDFDPPETADWAIFMATRKLQDQPRWDLAKADVDTSVTALATDFSCAADVRLDETTAPATLALMTRVRSDAAIGSSRAKGVYRRQRPFIGNAQPICVPRDDDLAASPSYPSGHATLGWTLGLVLAELVPDRAAQIMSRARAYGESRVVCGVHFASDIEAGRETGATVFAALQASPDFLADLAKARDEMKALKAKPEMQPYPGQCASESILAKRPW